MSLKERIQIDLKKSLQKKDELKISVLRLLNAAIVNREKAKRAKLSKEEDLEKLEELSQLTNEETLEVVASEVKKRKESIEQYEKGGRSDLVEQEKKELEILRAYLPEQMSEDEIRKLVQKTIKKIGASSSRDTGQVMGALMPQCKGKAEGGIVSKIVQEELKKEISNQSRISISNFL